MSTNTNNLRNFELTFYNVMCLVADSNWIYPPEHQFIINEAVEAEEDLAEEDQAEEDQAEEDPAEEDPAEEDPAEEDQAEEYTSEYDMDIEFNLDLNN